MKNELIKHTPEPWKINSLWPYMIYAENEFVASTSKLQTYTEQDAANARRICAAVNACAGIPTFDLETLPIDFEAMAKDRLRLQDENQKLREALKEIAGLYQSDFETAPQIARAAIAEAETTSAHPSTNVQHNQVIANLSEKLGSAIKALRDIAETLMETNGGFAVGEGNVKDAWETAKEALKPYHPDDPDPCDLARDYNDALRDADQPTPYDP